MPKLKDIKERLAKYPLIKNERNLIDKISHYHQLVTEQYQNLKQSSDDMNSILRVLSVKEHPAFKGKVLEALKKAIKNSKSLYNDISEELNKINTQVTEKSFIRIKESADDAKSKCKTKWEAIVDNEVTTKSNFVQVLDKLSLKKDGTSYNLIINQLRNYRNQIPQNEQQINKFINFKVELSEAIAKFDVEGDVGKFIKQALDGEAPARQLLEPEIQKKLVEFDLLDSLYITLSN